MKQGIKNFDRMDWLRVALCFMVSFSCLTAWAQTYVVTKTTDFDPMTWVPGNPDGFPNQVGTLQWAIRKANADLSAGPVYINFNITGTAPHTIQLAYELPNITRWVYLDGTTQPANGYQGIEPKVIVAAPPASSVNGFYFTSAASTGSILTGIQANNFTYAIYVSLANSIYISKNVVVVTDGSIKGAGIWMQSGSSVVHGNYVGVTRSGQSMGLFNYCIVGNGTGLFGNTSPGNANVVRGGTNGIAAAGSGAKYRISGNIITASSSKSIFLQNGGNELYAKPVITSFVLGTSGNSSVSGTAAISDAVEVFLSDAGGKNANSYLGTAIANGSGQWTLSGMTLNGNEVLIATATKNRETITSELSAPFTVSDPCSQVILNQNPILEPVTPLNFASVDPTANISWKVNSLPNPVPVVQYTIQVAPEKLDPATGASVPDWANKSQFITTPATTLVLGNSPLISITSLSPAITASNINKYYYWRVGIQYLPVDAQGHQPITWTSVQRFTLKPAAVSISQEGYLTNNSQHTNDINWVYGVSYLDNGLTSQGIAYIDGLGKSRQVQSLLNTQNRIMAVEAAYSEEGGGSVMSLPAPLAAGANFGYAHHFFDVLDNGQLRDFSTKDFDREVKQAVGVNTLMSPAPVDNSLPGSVGNYYSTTNTDANIDDAQGYPFAYNVGYKSPLQRPMLTAGGVGATFKMTAGKEYRHFYGNPSQEELNRVYGVADAPPSDKISRSLTYDPNGVGYITYKDNEGKVIATALTVCDNGAPSLKPLVEDGMSGFTVHIDPLKNDQIDSTTLAKQAGTKFFLPCSTNVNLKYELDINAFKVNGIGCRDCKFDVSVTVVNENTGAIVYTYTNVIIPSSTLCPVNPNDPTGTQHVIVIPSSTVLALAGPANYIINRTIKPYTDPTTGLGYITQTEQDFLNYVALNQAGTLLGQFTTEYSTETSWYMLRHTLSNVNAPVTGPQELPYIAGTFSGTGVACNTDGFSLNAEYYSPRGVTRDDKGNFYIADAGNNTIRKIDKTGAVTTLAGKACVAPGFVNAIGDIARFNTPYDLVFSPASLMNITAARLFVADRNNNAIRTVNVADGNTGMLMPFDGSGNLPTLINLPEGLGTDKQGNLYVASTGNNKIVKMNYLGSVIWIAGTGTAGSANGPIATATFNQPTDVAVDDNGNVYVSEKGSHLIRKISTAGVVSTVAGTGSSGSADGSGISASFNTPVSVGADAAGNIYVSDAGNNKVRRITAGTYYVQTIAGTGAAAFADGMGTVAKFNYPAGMYAGKDGTLHLADVFNNRIRVLEPRMIKCPPCVGAECNQDLWYVDKADVINITEAPFTKQIINLDGDANNDGAPGDETYKAASVTSGGLVLAGNPIRTNFIDAYKRMNWVDPTADISSMELYNVSSTQLNPNTVPVIGDDKKLNPLDKRQYYLLKVTKTKSTCVANCTPTYTVLPCSTQCDQQRLALLAELNEEEIKVAASTTDYSFLTQHYTLKQLIDETGFPLNSFWVSRLTDGTSFPYDNNDLAIYNAYEDARDAYEGFDVQRCMSLCPVPTPSLTACDICPPNYRSCVFENQSELSEGYEYLLDKWDAGGSFPYGNDLSILKPNDPVTGIPVPDPNEQSALGNLLFNFLVSRITDAPGTGIKVRAAWNAVGAPCNNCDPPATGTPTCTVTHVDVTSHFPDLLVATLQTANQRCISDYTACQQMNGDATSQNNYLCTQDRDECTAALGNSTDPYYTNPSSPGYGTYAASLANCTAMYNNCVSSTPVHPTSIDNRREAMIREMLNRLYPDPAQASLIDAQTTSIIAATASLNLMQLQKYLDEYESTQLCLINCEAQTTAAYQLWIANLIHTVSQQIHDGYMNQCNAKLNEVFDVSYTQNMYHYTLYNYDKGNNLISTVPPEGIDYVDIQSAIPAEKNRVPVHRMLSTYKPTSLFTITAASPDEGATEYIYDQAGRVRFSQSAEQLARGTTQAKFIFSYTKYDNETRVIEAGEYSANPLDDALMPVFTGFRRPSPGALGVYISDKANDINWPDVPGETFEETYIAYDGPGISFNLPTPHSQSYLQGRVSKTWNSEGVTHYSYDAHGRVNFAVQEINALSGAPSPGGYSGSFKTIDYMYTGLTSRVDQIIYQKGNVQEEFRQKYTYDNDYRLIKTEVSRNGGVSWLAESEYDYYLHGPLKRTSLGNKIQDIDLTYNINGWLKAINNPVTTGTYANEAGEGGTNTANFAKDVFGEAINYYRGDYQKTGAGLNSSSGSVPQSGTELSTKWKDLFNGNIGNTITNVAFNLTSANTTPNILAQSYQYDMLGRLTDTYAETQVENFTAFKPSGTGDDRYSLHMTYDANGNIMGMIRNSMTAGIKMDDFTYKKGIMVNDHYGSPKKQKNKTEHIRDAAGDLAGVVDIIDQASSYNASTPSTHNYEYDASGRLKTDKARGIELIEYTVYDKIKKVHFNALSGKPDVEFTYNQQQQRLTKKTINAGSPNANVTTIYSYDARGILLATYEYSDAGSGFKYKLNEHEMYGLKRIGNYKVAEEIVSNPSAPTNDAGKLRFEISDHRGDVRAIITGRKIDFNGDTYANETEIVSLSDYDAWGFTFQGRNFVVENNRYGYQGSEKDPELLYGTFYNTDFRGLDVARGEWMNPGPIISAMETPYAYSINNPILFNDPVGDDATISIMGTTITISSTIYLTGKFATEAIRQTIQTDIESVWSLSTFKYTDPSTGQEYDVKFEVDVIVGEPIRTQQDLYNPEECSDNIIELTDVPDGAFRSFVKNGNTGKWTTSTQRKGLYAHEFGHLLGFKDRYIDIYEWKGACYSCEAGLELKYVDEIPRYYKVSSVSPLDVANDDIMGKFKDNPRVLALHIKDIGDHAIKNATLDQPGGKARMFQFKSGIIHAGKEKFGSLTSAQIGSFGQKLNPSSFSTIKDFDVTQFIAPSLGGNGGGGGGEGSHVNPRFLH